MASNSEKMAAIISKAGVNARRVTVIGSYVHIDTFQKYRGALLDMMSLAGFRPIMEKDGVHMDSFDGFRMVFKAA